MTEDIRKYLGPTMEGELKKTKTKKYAKSVVKSLLSPWKWNRACFYGRRIRGDDSKMPSPASLNHRTEADLIVLKRRVMALANGVANDVVDDRHFSKEPKSSKRSKLIRLLKEVGAIRNDRAERRRKEFLKRFFSAIEINHLLTALVGKINTKISSVPQEGRILSKTICEHLMREANELGKTFKWTDRGATLPTQDQPIARFSKPSQAIARQALMSAYGHAGKSKLSSFRCGNLRLDRDVFVLKYSADESCGQTSLRKHIDGSSVALTVLVSLSTREDYVGGGTEFFRSSSDKIPFRLVRPPQGKAVVFPGNDIYHRGVAITKGRRYLLVGFFRSQSQGRRRAC
eukprot:g1096.t1